MFRAILLVVFSLSLMNRQSWAQQISSYVFNTSDATYTDLSGATNISLSEFDDAISSAQNIGFTFSLAGTNFSQFKLNSNGWITLNISSNQTTAVLKVLSTSETQLIAAFNRDLTGTSGISSHSYLTEGLSPNRICKIQYKNVYPYSTDGTGRMNFQIWLYETTNVVEVHYGSFTGNLHPTLYAYDYYAAQVGIKGATLPAVKSLYSSSNWNAPTVYANDTSRIYYNSATSILPSSGKVYRFTPGMPPPVITYTSLSSTSSTSDRSISATIIGTNIGTSLNAPRLWYRSAIGTPSGSYTFVSPDGSSSGSNYNFTIPGQVVGSTVQYYIAAQDDNGVSTNPEGGSGTNPPGSTPPNSPNQYQIYPSFAGGTTIPIGAGQTYSTLTSFAAALVNAEIVGGDLILELQSNYSDASETYPITFTKFTYNGAGNLIIRPSVSATNLVIGSGSSNSVISLDSVHHVTIDGRAGGIGTSQLTVRYAGSSSSNPTIRIRGGSQNSTIQYLTIEGGASNTAVEFGTNLAGSGNSYNTVLESTIKNRSGSSLGIGVASVSATAKNANNTISSCSISGFTTKGISISSGNQWKILNNQFFATTPLTPSGTFSAIEINGGTFSGGGGYTISENYIGGSSAFVGSSPMSISGGTSAPAYMISISTDTSAVTHVSNNIIANIAYTGSGFSAGFRALHLNSGKINATKNIIGSSSANDSLVLTCNGSSSMSSQGINIASSNGVQADSNQISRVYAPATSTGNNNFVGILVNTFSAVNPYTINDNTIQNIFINSGSSSSCAIQSTSFTAGALMSISRNTISTVSQSSTSTSAQLAALKVNSFGVFTIANNTIANISSSGTGTTLVTYSVAGMDFTAGGTSHVVEGNTIDNISSSAPSQATAAFGMYFSGSGSVAVRRNRVYQITNTSTSATARAHGMYLANSSCTVSNNQISVGNGITGNCIVGGIRDNSSFGNAFYFNSIYVGGNGTSTNSYCYSHEFTNFVVLKGNLFFNDRSGSGGSNYAYYISNTSGFSSTASDNNAYVSSDTTKLFNRSSSEYSFSGWKLVTSGDANSYFSKASEILSSSLFTSSSSGNLNVISSNAAGWLLNGKAQYNAIVTNDFVGNPRNGATDIGSVEFTPNNGVLAPIATASSNPTVGGTQFFTVFGRPVAKITWGNLVPSALDFRYYSGTPTPDGTSANSGNSYFELTATGVGEYVYTLALNYQLQDVGSLNPISLKLAQSQVSGGYTYLLGSTVDTTAKTLTATDLISDGRFAITSSENQLNVEWASFNASLMNDAVLLKWVTSTEHSNTGFEVQRLTIQNTQSATWEKIGFVSGNGTTTESHSYSFVDPMPSGKVQYRLKQIDFNGNFGYSPIIEINLGAPRSFSLQQNYPNPFNPSTVISYQLPINAEVNLDVFDMLGRKVAMLVKERKSAGSYQVSFDASQLSSGVYFYRLSVNASVKTGNFVQTKKMLLIK